MQVEGEVLNDRYQVIRPLGHGGMGAVYLVYDRQEEREIALKCFPPHARRVEDLAHFEHEFLTLSRLRHPNVAEVYDFGVIEGTRDVFFTSEFIDGQDLFEFSEGLAEVDLVRLLVQVCRGLDYIHSRHLIHYDIKPSNILVVPGGGSPQVKLIDFGLAAEQVDDALGVIKGTVSYLAPEVARHMPVDHRADLYSLGVTIFHCLTRVLPFRGETNLDVVRKVVSSPPPDPRDYGCELSDGLREVTLRLLAKDPGARFESGNDVIRALGRSHAEDFITEPRETTLTFVAQGGFFGRQTEFAALTQAFDAVFSWREDLDELPPPPPAQPHVQEQTSASGFVITASGSGLELDIAAAAPPTPPRSLVPGLEDTRSRNEIAIDWTPPSQPSQPPLPKAPPPRNPEEVPVPLPHLFLIQGEVGLGKSRLLKELKTHSQLRRVGVVEGSASGVAGRPYDAFVQVFRGILGLWYRDPDESAAAEPLRPTQNDPLRRRLLQRYGTEMVRLIPELDASFLPIASQAHLSPEQEEVRLLDALAQFLIGYTRSRPLVVLLHDLEQADLQTLELLRYLVRNLALIEKTREVARRAGAPEPRPLRLMVVASYRSSELDEGGRERLEEVTAAPITTTLTLQPLQQDQVHDLIESMLGVGSDPRKLARRIYDETKGNPYFTVELVRSLVESGALVKEGGEWVQRLDKPGSLAIPHNVTELILERVRRTSPEERVTLNLLAVLGRPTSVTEVAALTGRATRELVPRLSALESRQVLHEELAEGGRRYDFINDVARQAVYDAITPDERVTLHATCGDFLERRAGLGNGAVELGELVRHFTAAGDRAKALGFGIQAGDEARAVHANHRALEFYGAALTLLPSGSSRWRDLLQRSAELLLRIGDYERAVEACDRILSLSEELRPNELVDAYRRRAEVRERRGDYEGALEDLAQGTAVAYAEDGLRREAAALFGATASIYLRTGRYQDAIGFCSAGLRKLEGVPEGQEAATIHTVLGRARLALGETQAAEEELERSLAMRRRLGDDAGIASSLADLGSVALATGELDEAVSRFERALERETAMGHAAGIAQAAQLLARACRELGDTSRATSLLRRALSIHEKSGARAEVVRVLVDLADAATTVASYEKALKYVTRAREEAQELALLDQQARAHNAEARLMLKLGDMRRAVDLSSEGLRLASLQGDIPRERAVALELLGLAELGLGQLDGAEPLFYEAQAMQRAQNDARGVRRTTLTMLEIFVRRGDAELFEATLGELGELGRHERARVLMLRAWNACQAKDGPQPGCLGDLERAAAWADTHRDLELAWRVALVRGRVLRALGEGESALAAYVEAMSAIRDLVQRVPEAWRDPYVGQADCVACKEEFKQLRQSGFSA